MLSVGARDLSNIVKGGALGRSIINLQIDGGKSRKAAIIKELQTHPVTHAPLHIDLYEVAMDRKIKVHVPVVATGHSKGVDVGGLLQIVRRDLEVLCLPDEIPESFAIDVTDLDIGDAVHVEDIQTSAGVEIPHETNFTVLTVTSPKVEAEEVAEEGEEEAAEALAGDEESDTEE
jgi:large subunit ribosomal protein L25